MDPSKILELHRLAEIGKLSAGFIHDLANHITVMSLSLDRVEESLLRDKEQIEAHTAESARVRKNIKYFVDAMRKHIRGQDIHCYFSVEKRLYELITLFKHKAEKEQVSLCISREKIGQKTLENLRLYGSRIRFNQLFSNLISNAIDSFCSKVSSEDRRVNIEIKKRADQIVISVTDNGSGIDPKIKDKIFDTFFTTKTNEKGVGLGLATVKEIVERDFSGSISVKSTLSKGSVFSVSIPLRSPRRKSN